jgi:hypothetical protein
MTTEPLIAECLTWFKDLARQDLDAAVMHLEDTLFDEIDTIPFPDIMYVYKQVLIRFFCTDSGSICQAARRMKMASNTLFELRRRIGPELQGCRPENPMPAGMNKRLKPLR